MSLKSFAATQTLEQSRNLDAVLVIGVLTFRFQKQLVPTDLWCNGWISVAYNSSRGWPAFLHDDERATQRSAAR